MGERLPESDYRKMEGQNIAPTRRIRRVIRKRRPVNAPITVWDIFGWAFLGCSVYVVWATDWVSGFVDRLLRPYGAPESHLIIAIVWTIIAGGIFVNWHKVPPITEEIIDEEIVEEDDPGRA